jgi:hypothetical protein
MGEAQTGREAEFQDYLLRELMSEGILRYPVSQKVGGAIVTVMIERHGPVAFMVTTTKNKLNPENETRMLSLELDDSERQTRAVLSKIAEVEGYNEGAEQIDFELWHNYQRWLAAGETTVIMPFARTLVDMIPPRSVRLRRDARQLIIAVKAHALLHRHHRRRNEQGAIRATLEDYTTVRELLGDVIAAGAEVKVREQIVETIAAVEELENSHGSEGVSVREVAKRLRLDRSTAPSALGGGRARVHPQCGRGARQQAGPVLHHGREAGERRCAAHGRGAARGAAGTIAIVIACAETVKNS